MSKSEIMRNILMTGGAMRACVLCRSCFSLNLLTINFPLFQGKPPRAVESKDIRFI